MKLWIRSQDKKILMKSPELRYNQKGNDHSLLAYDTLGVYRIIGVYETEERAIGVLDEIQKIIKWCQRDMKDVTIGDMNNLKGCFEDYVYEMPEE